MIRFSLSRAFGSRKTGDLERVVTDVARRSIPLERQLVQRDMARIGKASSGVEWRLHAGLEARYHSQNGEDGLLMALFTRLGTTDSTVVEFGVAEGLECLGRNLVQNLGWRGLLMDGSRDNVLFADWYYHEIARLSRDRVRNVCVFVTEENINGILQAKGFGGDPDLLVIDLDGNDYWVWRAITVVRPRVVVVEYNASFGPDRSITVPYDPAFKRLKMHPSGLYHGASLRALDCLAREKGYGLAGCDDHGVNAFFVRDDVAAGRLEPVSPVAAFRPNAHRAKLGSVEEQFKLVAELAYVDVAAGARRPA